MKLHLGCGRNIMPGWENLDGSPEKGAKKWWAPKLPYQAQSVEFIYSEHFLEHLPKKIAVETLKECFRVLRPGGFLRISTPNLRNIALSYLHDMVPDYSAVGWFPKSPCDFFNEAVREWGHLYIWDQEELFSQLSLSGFSLLYSCNYKESPSPGLSGLETRPNYGDLIVEAKR